MAKASTAAQQVPQRYSREARNPDFVVRAPDPQRRGRWVSVGVAWSRDNGEGINIKLNTVPVGNGWDGTLIALPPLSNGNGDPEQVSD